MQINYKRLLFDIFITFLIGNLFLFTIDTYFYDHLIKPFSVPSFVFPIVWSFLYLVMGISLYLIEESSSPDKKSAIFLYYFQLIGYLYFFILNGFFLLLFGLFFCFFWCVFYCISFILFEKLHFISIYLIYYGFYLLVI